MQFEPNEYLKLAYILLPKQQTVKADMDLEPELCLQNMCIVLPDRPDI